MQSFLDDNSYLGVLEVHGLLIAKGILLNLVIESLHNHVPGLEATSSNCLAQFAEGSVNQCSFNNL